jgi:hypothetical protein
VKPKVFLSHSKLDRQFIERLATDLRSARIDVWYDEWEIPPGEPFRRHIFEYGIPECDLFFVYLTPNSITSYWCTRELDAAFIRDAETEGGFIAIFVDSDQTRSGLSLDLRALYSPVLNEKEYERPFSQLISRAWEALLRKRLQQATQESRLEKLALENTIANLQLAITKMQISGAIDLDRVRATMDEKRFSIGPHTLSVRKAFSILSNALASGAHASTLMTIIVRELGLEEYGIREKDVRIRDCLGPLIVLGLVQVHPRESDWGEFYLLTNLGQQVALEDLTSNV